MGWYGPTWLIRSMHCEANFACSSKSALSAHLSQEALIRQPNFWYHVHNKLFYISQHSVKNFTCDRLSLDFVGCWYRWPCNFSFCCQRSQSNGSVTKLRQRFQANDSSNFKPTKLDSCSSSFNTVPSSGRYCPMEKSRWVLLLCNLLHTLNIHQWKGCT